MLKSFASKLNKVLIRINPKIVMRSGLAVLSAVAVAVGFLMVNNYTVIDGENTYTVKSYANSAAGIAGAAGIYLGEDDTASFDKKGVITVDRTFAHVVNPETLLAAAQINENVVLYTNELLYGYEAGGILGEEDDGSYTVKECKIEYVYETVTRTVKHGYKKVYSSDLEKGKSKITEGKNGEKEVVFYKKLVNGIVVESEVHSETVTVKPVTEVETIGTRVSYNSANAVKTSADVKCISTIKPKTPIELDKNGKPVAYAKVITGKASAYWPGEDGGEYCSTGVKAQPGYVAVNPKQIPYGTKMYIVSADGKYVYGYAIAADTGGFATNGSGRIVDLRFPSASSGSAFGVRNVNIYILD